MLAVVTVAVLASAVVLGLVTSSENILAVLLAGIGAFVLLPVTLLVVVLDSSIAFLSGFVPAVENWQSTFAGLTAGAYGFDGWHYLVAAVPLWFIVVVQFADDDETEDDSADTTTDGDSEGERRKDQSTDSTPVESTSSPEREINEGGSTRRTTGELQSVPLTDLGGVDEGTAEALSAAGYETTEHVAAANQDNLTAIEGVSTALAARIKAETAGVKPSDEVADALADLGLGTGASGTEGETEGDGVADEGRVEPVADETDKESQSLQDEVRSLLDTITEPLADLGRTESRLVRAHAKAVALAESAPDQDTRERAQEQLEEIESRLDVVPDLADALETARSRVPPEQDLSRDTQTERLDRARGGYDTAIEVARRGGFPTDRLEREREAITAELDRRKSPKRPLVDTEDESDTEDDDTDAEDDDAPQREALVEELQRLDGETEGYPLTTELRDIGEYDPGQYCDRFGSWEDALEAAGIDKEQRLVADIRRVAELVDGPPSTVDMVEHGVHSSGTHSKYFGTWAAAIEAAGFDQETEQSEGKPRSSAESAVRETENESDGATKTEYVEAIDKVARTTGKVVKSTDVSEQSPYSAHEIINAFGSWQDALEAAEVDNKARLLQELRRVGDEMGHPPTTTEMNEHGHVSATMYADYFGSFTDARERAYSDSSTEGEHKQDDNLSPPSRGSSTERTQQDTSDTAHERSPVSRINSGGLLSEDTTETADPFATVADITEDGRLGRAVAVNICEVTEEGGIHKQACLLVEDLDGERCRLNVWQTHDINVTWQVGHWYVLEKVRGKVWTSDGKTKRRLSTTGDLLVTHAGTDRPSKENAVDDSESTDNTCPTSESTDESAADETESETILSEVVSEFEDLPDTEDS